MNFTLKREKMIAISIIAILNSALFISCNKTISSVDTITTDQIMQVAAKYNYKVSDLQPSTYKVTTLYELNKILEEMKNYKESQHIQSLVENNKTNVEFSFAKSQIEVSKIAELSKGLHLEKKKVKATSTDDGPNNGASGYKYSKTYYLWGSGTSPNYYVRVDYNTDGKGHFVGDPLFSSGIFGYSMTSYNQIGYNFYLTPNGELVFEITGLNKVALSVRGYTLTDGTVTTFTGYFNLFQPGTSGTSLDFGQFAGGSIWWTLTAPTRAQK